jgi:hypothetical protein
MTSAKAMPGTLSSPGRGGVREGGWSACSPGWNSANMESGTFIMTRKLVLLAVSAALAAPARTRRSELSPEVRAKAEKVAGSALRTIESGAAPCRRQGKRSMTFTEAEFNAWIAYRLEEEKEPYVKSAELKLLADDKVEGRIVLDLGKRQGGGPLWPRVRIFSFRPGSRPAKGGSGSTWTACSSAPRSCPRRSSTSSSPSSPGCRGPSRPACATGTTCPPGVLTSCGTKPGRLVVIH